MMDAERLETCTLTNEELQQEIVRLSAQIDNLTVQISDYRQIVAELSRKIKDSSDKI
jgi:cell division protein FtsL